MNKMILLLLGILFLTGCVAIKEPTAQLANSGQCLDKKTKKQIGIKKQNTYKQRGKCYAIMKSSKYYEEKGIASWYGRGFQRKKTSSGERFNMYSMTAAHKTLPLATRVQVTNLKNGKKVIVRINDRGPFTQNRLIDLSYGAAKKLGILGRGTAPVSVKALA